MGKINILSEELCNRIAAGEVIERPFSVVKELVENSIDAGATEIEIAIERGGKDLISVTDNGCGIEKDDMRAAFFSHATSKIKELDDISHIRTLGFRGEALATIASVALVELVSAVEGQEGNKVECDGDMIGKVQPAACEKGTKITVRNLFFNTPVRFKFMKTDKKEEGDITTFVIRYILGNPDISFKYFVDGQLKLQSYGGGLDEAITQVYGAKVLPNCFKISAERNNIKVHGFISNQQYFKSNKTYQTTFLNGRYINNQIISSSINNAYGPYMMKKNFPFYVLFIEMSDELVDVNAHPNKTDVRFSDGSLIYGTIYKIISSILEGSVKAADFVVPDDATSVGTSPAQTGMYSAEFVSNENVRDTDFSDVVDIEKYSVQKQAPKPKSATDGIDTSPYENYEAPDFNKDPLEEKTTLDYFGKRDLAGSFGEDPFSSPELVAGEETSYDREAEERKKIQQQQFEFCQFKYRGTLFNTYLMYEVGNDVYIIDQHAAHERVIYDSLKEKMASKSVDRQILLVPYIFTVNPDEYRFIDDNKQYFWDVGFTFDPFGPSSFMLSSFPVVLNNINPETFMTEILAHVTEYKNITLTDILKDKLAQTACKHAIKGGDALTDAERDKLLELIKGNMGLKCPHGRPVCVKLTKTELEKMFKRKL